MTDGNLVLQASTTKTATFSSTALDLKKGTPRRGMKARVIYSAANIASGSGTTISFQIDHSDDNSTWYTLSRDSENDLTLTTTAQSGEVFLPFETSKRYIRLTMTLTLNSGVTPTITYQGDITMGRVA